MSEIPGQYTAASTRPRQSHPTVSDKPLLRIEGYAICAVILRNGMFYLQFKDKWKERVHARGGSEYIEISLQDFGNLVKEVARVESTESNLEA